MINQNQIPAGLFSQYLLPPSIPLGTYVLKTDQRKSKRVRGVDRISSQVELNDVMMAYIGFLQSPALMCSFDN